MQWPAPQAWPVVTIEVPRHLVNAAKITPDQLKVGLAVHLYQTRRLGIGHARELAGMSLWEFRQLLGSCKISPHHDVADLDADMKTRAGLDGQ